MTQKKSQSQSWKNVCIVCTAMVCLTGLEGYALYLGMNGVLLTTSVAVIAGLAGLSMPQTKIIK